MLVVALLHLLTLAAEIGGVSLALQLITGISFRIWAMPVGILIWLFLWRSSFDAIEYSTASLGMVTVCFVVAAVWLHPSNGEVLRGLLPSLPKEEPEKYWLYAVSILGALIAPYLFYFYSSGAVEDKWKPSDVPLNRVIVIVGFVLGSVLAVSLIMIGAQYFGPRHIEPQLPGVVANSAAVQFGAIGLLIAIAGMFFAFAGAAIETGLCAAYNIAQFFGWPWGKFRPPREASRFALTWVTVFAIATLIVLSGMDPISVVEYSIVFSVVILPLTYFPLLLVASDKRVMGRHANGPLTRALGWFYLAITTIAALAAIPLLMLTHAGKG
jgi:manganese transport protein